MGLELPFVTLDVFARERFKGNPLAVVTIPKGTHPKPTTQQKQTVAREFNLSETVFVHEETPGWDDQGTSSSDGGQRRHIEIFLPDQEVPFAGHPTIGTAVSLLPRGITTLITKAGPIALAQPIPGTVQAAIPHDVHLHQARLRSLPSFSPGDLSAVPEIREAELGAPIFSLVDGLAFILVPLASLELLSQVTLSPAKFPQDRLIDPGFTHGFICRLYYVILDEGPGKVLLRSRMMAGTFEDPATGSASCALGSYLALHSGDKRDRTIQYEITQGVEMGRESNILVEVDLKNDVVDQVRLAGTATQVMHGFISL
ncbi:unnamed protein product [Clonostachys rhizophaga]|uniref:Phenazine biosynthesis protein n=1 Tax=Clonostachys rhizophaga TaxID=160324 RepID=A0A9N9YEI6_9HYPO|nr:unnamed protein product [Clonostachys rhizophaga]